MHRRQTGWFRLHTIDWQPVDGTTIAVRYLTSGDQFAERAEIEERDERIVIALYARGPRSTKLNRQTRTFEVRLPSPRGGRRIKVLSAPFD